jgi:5-methylcytosine-specific restriction endonuclease McrA
MTPEARERRRALERARYAANPEYFRAKARADYRRNKERRRARSKMWLEENREASRAASRTWAKNNPGKRAMYQRNREVEIARATPPWANRDALLFVYNQAAVLGLTVDHIHPIKHPHVCGLHVPWNLQLITREENASKGNRCFPQTLAPTVDNGGFSDNGRLVP